MVKSANWERLLWIVALIPLGATYASSQQSPDLDRQLEQLKQQYEQTTQRVTGAHIGR